MAQKLRLGVIGAGSWTVSSHLPNLVKRKDDVEFVGVCRKGPELLEKIREDFGFELASEDYRDILAADVDIVVVGSPVGLHYEHAKASLAAGAHVLCEKPFTVDPAHAWELVELGQANGRHLLLSYGWNYRPMLREAKRLMDEKGVGEIEQVTIAMSSVTRELLSNTGDYPGASPEAVPDQATWTDPRISGGGYGQAQLTHALGVSLWLTGLRGDEVFAFMASPGGAPVELHDAISIRFRGGAVGSLAGGSSHLGAGGNRHALEVRAIGSEGQLQLDLERDLLWLYRGPDDDLRVPLDENAGLYDCEGPPNTLVDLALGKDVENCSPGELGARTVEILDASYRSAASGTVARVDTQPS